MCFKKKGASKQSHCYSKREEATWHLFLNNNDPVFSTLLFAQVTQVSRLHPTPIRALRWEDKCLDKFCCSSKILSLLHVYQLPNSVGLQWLQS